MRQENKFILDIPENITNVRIDIGTSVNAPYSAHWLSLYQNLFVIMVEPNPENIISLKTGKGTERSQGYYSIILDSGNIFYKGKLIDTLSRNNKFQLFECAIDNVEQKEERLFYCTSEENSGCSSLSKPTNLIIPVKKIVNTEVISMSHILDSFPWDRIPYIDFVKTDTQSYDLNVVKSFNNYLKKICFIQSEYYTNDQYENSKSNESSFYEFNELLVNNNFSLLKRTEHDLLYVNNELKNYIRDKSITPDSEIL